ncbi:hypothetical protein DdX_11511 [Ditylenchus destructor]|uniref:Uncharacterized protein n=1 Tax=Ditylenchus destructor TaxID=166010 RepID=A0AAD4R4B7_9BILA|nr:hypothetical protein DdX_11511 [Ditylenchus destructor]
MLHKYSVLLYFPLTFFFYSHTNCENNLRNNAKDIKTVDVTKADDEPKEEIVYKENDSFKFAHLIGGKNWEEFVENAEFITKMLNWYATDIEIEEADKKHRHSHASARHKRVFLHAMNQYALIMPQQFIQSSPFSAEQPNYRIANGNIIDSPIKMLYDEIPFGDHDDEIFALDKALAMGETLSTIYLKEKDFLVKHTQKFVDQVQGESRERQSKIDNFLGVHGNFYKNSVLPKIEKMLKMKIAAMKDPVKKNKLRKIIDTVRDLTSEAMEKLRIPAILWALRQVKRGIKSKFKK